MKLLGKLKIDELEEDLEEIKYIIKYCRNYRDLRKVFEHRKPQKIWNEEQKKYVLETSMELQYHPDMKSLHDGMKDGDWENLGKFDEGLAIKQLIEKRDG